MSAIGVGLGVLIDQLRHPAAAGPTPLTWDEVRPMLDDIAAAFSVIRDTMDSADRQTHEAVTAATDAATQIEEIGSDLKDITEHTYTVVIPHSLSWLAGYVVSHWIDPLRAAIASMQHTLAFLLGWRGQIDSWRRNFVDPNVEKWVGFRQWFDTWPQSVLFRWHEWFDHPDEFAQWAAAPLVGPIVSYLAASGHQQTRDALADIIVKAWAEEPDRILDDMLVWLTTD